MTRAAPGAAVAQPRDRIRDDAPRAAPLRIVLVEPKIPPNTGNVARLCAATGSALHLVEPLGFSIDDRALKRAGLDYWHALDLVIHPSLEHALVALGPRIWLLSTRGERRYDGASYEAGDALVFGAETTGLPGSVLARYPGRTLRVPMRTNSVRSLNLATTVGIVAYAALSHLDFPGLDEPEVGPTPSS